MCYNMECNDRRTCDKCKKASCIRKMSSDMFNGVERIRKMYNTVEEDLKDIQEKASEKITIEDLLDRKIIEKLRMIS